MADEDGNEQRSYFCQYCGDNLGYHDSFHVATNSCSVAQWIKLYDAEVLDVPWARERYKLRHDAWARRHSMPPNVCRARQWVGGKLQPPCLCNSL